MNRWPFPKGTSIEVRLAGLSIPEPNTGCWLWLGSLRPDGYGQLSVNGRSVPAYRASYEFHVGPIPSGLTIDHDCRNRGCVNPAHLEPVTQRENVLRGTSPTAMNARKTHCLRGHEFSPENTRLYRRKAGVIRHCLTCQKIRDSAAAMNRAAS